MSEDTKLPSRIYIEADYDPAEYQGHGGFFTAPFANVESAVYVRESLATEALNEIEAALISIADGVKPSTAISIAFTVINRERVSRHRALKP